MSHAVYSFNRFHLGDNLVFLHLLRALAKQRVSTPFVHFCHGQGIPQLREVVADIPNIILEPFESPLWQEHEHEAVDTWKNSGAAWESSPLRWDWSAYTLWHHGELARKMGAESPLTRREHLLLDYPALLVGPTGLKFDFFVCNSEPCSGQFKPMAKHESGYLDGLVRALVATGKTVLLTKHLDPPWFSTKEEANRCFQPDPDRREPTISKYGYLSQFATHHVMIATGPMWPTLNTTNHHNHEGRRRIALLDNGENLNLPHIEQVANVEQVMKIAQEAGWI